MSAVTAWVEPPASITGRDHLGSRVPCEILYARLIPGITNVTNRARCYSFYPWLIWAFGQRYKSLSSSEFIESLRRADCLLTLIGAWHGGDPEDSWRHGGELVGRSVLLNALKDLKQNKICRLSNYTRLKDSSERYFKNKLGGLGQYYLGPLRELGVLEGDAKSLVKYTRERGGVLAEAFDERGGLKKFFDAVEEDRITISTLKSLNAFCPCGLTSNAGERSALVDLFFNRPGIFSDDDGRTRRQTLALLLDFVAQIENLTGVSDQGISNEWLFRASAYTGALPDGKAWAAPSALEQIRRGWMAYQRNEMLSVALQGIFWAALGKLLKDRNGFIENRQAFGDWFVSSFAQAVLGNKQGETFAVAVERVKKRIPGLTDWMDESHEIQLAWKLVDGAQSNADTKTHERVVHLAIDILLALAARSANEADSYEGFISPAELTDYSINLFTFHERSRETWREMRLTDLLRRLVTEWGLDVHFRVALRKLRGDSHDTFRIRPTDKGLEVIAAPPPEFSNPRLRQAFHILCDLGAMERDHESGLLSLTDLGRSLLEECRG
jgi:hypothetical protein